MIDWQWLEFDLLESQEKWNEAKSLLIKNLEENPYDLKVNIRLGFLCWYLVVEEEPLGVKNVDLDELTAILNQVTNFGLTNFNSHEDILWIFGWMISLFPYYFGDYDEWEEKGKAMLKRAHVLNPDDPVYRYSYISSISFNELEKKNEYEQLQVVLEDRFQGKGVLSDYFKDIWHSS